MVEINITFFIISDVRLTEAGYTVTFPPGKQKRQILKDFLIPAGTLEYDMFHRYISVILGGEVKKMQPNNRLWLRGNEATETKRSFFSNAPLGDRTIREIPRYIAKKLGYDENTQYDFTGHSFRHSGATILADSGVPTLSIQKVLNHKRPNVSFIHLSIIDLFCNFSFLFRLQKNMSPIRC